MPEKDIKIIERKNPSPFQAEELTSRDKLILFAVVFGSFLVLISLITFLPFNNTLRILSLLIGSFLLIDLHKTLKSKSYAGTF